jgi:hypothetical protein
VQVTFQARVTDTVPAVGLAIANVAEMVNLSAPGGPAMARASARIEIGERPVYELLLPVVVRGR